MRTKEKDVIWIIVPVYNVEKVLHKCIKSIYKQTYTSWKLILVDDGSTDRSGRMCDMYAEKDSRIFTIHTINGGPHVARVKGISSIDNEGYCCFCDSDDEMPPDALQILYKEVKRTNADFVCGNIQRIYKGIKLPINSSPSCFETPGIYEKKDILSNLYLCCFGGGRFPVNLVGKLYKTNIIKTAMLSITKYPKCFAEDLNVTMHLLPKINRCSVISDVVYNYRIGGGTSRFMPTFLDDNILMYRIKMDMADQCTSELDVKRLVGVELKNIIVSYWIMCEKHRRYPSGSLLDEVRVVCEKNEVKEAMTMLEGDSSGLAGVNQPLISGNYEIVCDLIRNKVKEDRPKDIIKKILIG